MAGLWKSIKLLVAGRRAFRSQKILFGSSENIEAACNCKLVKEGVTLNSFVRKQRQAVPWRISFRQWHWQRSLYLQGC